MFVWYEQRAGWVWFLCVFFSDEEFGPYNISWQLAIDLQQKSSQTFYDVFKVWGFFVCFWYIV